MRLIVACTLVSGWMTVVAQQQQQSPFVIPPTGPTPPAPAQPAQPTPQQGVAANPTGDLGTVPGVNDVATNALGRPATNATARSAFGTDTNQLANATGTTAPLFLNVSGTVVMDANGQPIGTIQQIVLDPSGTVTFAVVSTGGRLVPIPWQLIAASTVPGRTGLTVNAEQGLIQRAPPVLMGHLPMLTEEAAMQQIFNHFGVPVPNRFTTVGGTSQGGTGRGLGVTLTGGETSTGGGTNSAFTTGTNRSIGGITASNQAVNTTGGLSPTGRTNAAFDGFNSGPGSTDRLGPRQNTNAPTTPPNPVAPRP